MQPYFMPYLGYLRLLFKSDIFVVYDCVQFPRRGWVHRNQLNNYAGKPSWLTLPIKKSERCTKIKDIYFSDKIDYWWEKAYRKFPALHSSQRDHARYIAGSPIPNSSLVDYLVEQLFRIKNEFGFSTNIIRSSELKINDELKNSSRILKICAKLNATQYINSPGGRKLYDSHDFNEMGIELRFLPEWNGNNMSLLERLATEPKHLLEQEIVKQSRI